MLEISNLALPLDAGLEGAQAEKLVRRAAARALGVAPRDIAGTLLLKRSVDARKKHDVRFVATLGVELAGGEAAEAQAVVAAADRRGAAHVKVHQPYEPLQVPQAADAPRAAAEPRPVVVGTGPAGLFCALYLARAGLRPLVVERGAAVDDRLRAVEAFNGGADLDPHANIQFGEGGAGTFSDGKLTTNIKSPWAAHVLHLFVEAGAPEEILWQAKPHIGTDLLVDVVRTMRGQIEAAGGEVRFATQLTGLEAEGGELVAVELTDVANGQVERVPARRVVLACGHSARDTFEAVRDAGVFMEQKPFSVGVRIEHPQRLIDRAQYGKAADHPALGAADYKLSVHLRPGAGRGSGGLAEREGGSRSAACPGKGGEGHGGKKGREGATRADRRGDGAGADGRGRPDASRKRGRKESPATASRPALRSGAAGEQGKRRSEAAQGRGVYTFCMCPGGEVVCAASELGGVVVNGMSRFARDGRNANSALLVGVGPDDFGSDDPLAGVELQRTMERAAYDAAIAAGGKPYQAPAQTVGDFLAHRGGASGGAGEPGAEPGEPGDVAKPLGGGNFAGKVRPTYARGVAWCDLHEVLPPFVADAIAEALPLLDRRLHGFADPQAVMTGVETRSSSPVRIVRGKNLQARFDSVRAGDAKRGPSDRDGASPREAPSGICGEAHAGRTGFAKGDDAVEPEPETGLYPCGEGAGYAGGIMSAACDGLRVAAALVDQLMQG